jgi:hypothetical protein
MQWTRPSMLVAGAIAVMLSARPKAVSADGPVPVARVQLVLGMVGDVRVRFPGRDPRFEQIPFPSLGGVIGWLWGPWGNHGSRLRIMSGVSVVGGPSFGENALLDQSVRATGVCGVFALLGYDSVELWAFVEGSVGYLWRRPLATLPPGPPGHGFSGGLTIGLLVTGPVSRHAGIVAIGSDYGWSQHFFSPEQLGLIRDGPVASQITHIRGTFTLAWQVRLDGRPGSLR